MSSNPPPGPWPSDGPHGSGSGSDPTMVPGSGQPYGGSYQQPQTPSYGAPSYGAPQYGAPQYGAPPYGSPPGGGYGGPPPGGGSSSGRSPVLPFLAGVLATLIVVGAGIGVLFVTGGGIVGDRDRDTSTASDRSPSGGTTESESASASPGGETLEPDSPETLEPSDEITPTESGSFDELHAACEQGDFTSCDRLYFDTPVGSDQEHFGSTCGDRIAETQGYCTEWSSYTRPASGSGDFDRSFDRLWTQCEQGTMEACDQLWVGSPIGSVYEEFGSTCAGRTSQTEGGCAREIDYL